MAINKTGAMFKAFTFDGESSRDYGVYITGAAVYNAPEREIEMISIPARNGAFALDKGRFENIEVTYTAGVFADNESDFAEALSDLRNMLCSKKGYCRLTDEYNPNEYREAIYKSGLEVEATQLRAGEFEITFECKPQRFLTSGETAVTMTNGGTLTNPTRFDAHPLVELYGYGTARVNGYPIEIDNIPIGRIQIAKGGPLIEELDFNPDLVNNGDPLTITGPGGNVADDFGSYTITNVGTVTKSLSLTNATCDYYTVNTSLNGTRNIVNHYVLIYSATFTVGTEGSVLISFSHTVSLNGGTTTTRNYQYEVEYDGDTNISFYKKVGGTTYSCKSTFIELSAISSVSALGNPTYIDCDLGVSYKIENSELVSLDHTIDLGMKLPVLNPGVNTVTFDNTFSRVDVVPRWWKL